MLILGSQLSYDSDAIENDITRRLNLFYSSYDSVQVSPDAVGHGTVGFIQMTDGHDIADVAEDDTGQLQLIIFHIGSAVEAQHIAIDGCTDDDQGIGNTALIMISGSYIVPAAASQEGCK